MQINSIEMVWSTRKWMLDILCWFIKICIQSGVEKILFDFLKIFFAKYFSTDRIKIEIGFLGFVDFFFLLGRYFVLFVYLLEDKFPY